MARGSPARRSTSSLHGKWHPRGGIPIRATLLALQSVSRDRALRTMLRSYALVATNPFDRWEGRALGSITPKDRIATLLAAGMVVVAALLVASPSQATWFANG